MNRQPIFFALLIFTLFLAACQGGEETATAERKIPAEVDFNLHVKPILSDRCFACHGPDNNKREAGLRLDTEEGAFGALKESKGHAFVAGKPQESVALMRMTSTDPDEVMPPPESNLELTNYEIGVIEKWLEQGAEWKNHWAFIPPERPELPEVRKDDWVQNPVDNFVLAKLEEEGFKPAEKASKAKLLRRVTFDLTGLPPTVEELDNFLKDDTPNAYEKVVDRLLASPQFGEKWASMWLDLARYADSKGYQKDHHRNIWKYRDWVIDAFNENKPFDQFTREQIAEELSLPPVKIHCSVLAEDAIKAAIVDYQKKHGSAAGEAAE